MARVERERAFFGLAARETNCRCFDTVVDRVAQQVAERRFEEIEDVAIHLSRFAHQLPAHLLAKRARDVAHHARQTAGAVAERAHPALQRGIVKLLRQMRRAAVEALQIGQALGEQMLRFCGEAAQFFERGVCARIELQIGKCFVQLIQRTRAVTLDTLDAQHRLREGFEPARFDQRFAG